MHHVDVGQTSRSDSSSLCVYMKLFYSDQTLILIICGRVNTATEAFSHHFLSLNSNDKIENQFGTFFCDYHSVPEWMVIRRTVLSST